MTKKLMIEINKLYKKQKEVLASAKGSIFNLSTHQQQIFCKNNALLDEKAYSAYETFKKKQDIQVIDCAMVLMELGLTGFFYTELEINEVFEEEPSLQHNLEEEIKTLSPIKTYRLAICYLLGVVKQKNCENAMTLLFQAASEGVAQAQSLWARLFIRFSICYKLDFSLNSTLWELLNLAASHGTADALRLLAYCYLNDGSSHCKKDIVKGLSLLKLAASQGDFESLCKLGRIYYKGLFDVSKNKAVAARLLHRAAKIKTKKRYLYVAGVDDKCALEYLKTSKSSLIKFHGRLLEWEEKLFSEEKLLAESELLYVKRLLSTERNSFNKKILSKSNDFSRFLMLINLCRNNSDFLNYTSLEQAPFHGLIVDYINHIASHRLLFSSIFGPQDEYVSAKLSWQNKATAIAEKHADRIKVLFGFFYQESIKKLIRDNPELIDEVIWFFNQNEIKARLQGNLYQICLELIEETPWREKNFSLYSRLAIEILSNENQNITIDTSKYTQILFEQRLSYLASTKMTKTIATCGLDFAMLLPIDLWYQAKELQDSTMKKQVSEIIVSKLKTILHYHEAMEISCNNTHFLRQCAVVFSSVQLDCAVYVSLNASPSVNQLLKLYYLTEKKPMLDYKEINQDLGVKLLETKDPKIDLTTTPASSSKKQSERPSCSHAI